MLKRMFAIDLRSLALFRVCMAVVLIGDYLDRAASLFEHYTDWGSMPREALPFDQNYLWAYSVHALSGNWEWIAFLFVAGVVIASLFLVGYYSRLMNFLSWALLASLQMRNFVILYGADVLLKVLLFWSIFLPTGARFSLDRAAYPDQKEVPKKILSFGSVAILLQVCFVYWFSVAYKWNADWLEGHSVYYALHIDQFVTPWGVFLREYPALLTGMTYSVLALEALGPLFAIFPFRSAKVRIFTVFLMIAMHIGFGMTLYLGLFSYIASTAWLLFLPGEFWDWFFETRLGIALYEWFSAVSNSFRRFTSKLTRRPIGIKSLWPTNILIAAALISVFVWNCYAVAEAKQQMPAISSRIVKLFHLQQNWNMFSRPLRYDGWFIIAGKLVSGKVVDLFKRGKPIDWNKPPMVSDTYYNSRWRKNMINLIRPEFKRYLPYYCKWWCREWNAKHTGDEQLEVVQVVYMAEVTRADHTIDPPKKMLYYTHFCN